MSTSVRESDPFEALDASEFAFTRRVWVDAAPDRVYGLVSNVSAIGRWSPTASDVAFDPGAGPETGAWFSGTNHRDGKQWTTRSQIVTAVPGTAFAFVVGGAADGIVHWSWTFHPAGRGTVVEQSWRLLRLDPVLGTDRADLDRLRDFMTDSVDLTLLSLAQWIAEEHRP
ncbi:SRPBCC family protein [Streptomyces broussonetiae]|uniref:SRPBCC family protein n=1 Tax=Streptomyces broussonetiae TaxID=2686304 RepID=A0A6I6N586_9ACTN|nr:SRPBCC family protein [Streptomyces broussonetiae]QHA08003.1 SRPBCC family protein [Streptomyces broussonetiae]